ncbi:hypothetical protein T440DRAFT_441272 [Plenodomus tracheiphilus IPT5]|uniref:SWIM-type domain-containing protein n=1 Tax=Plenodomus tracheiphilus IPT5 TaxID=1408161 RepID=A0A6A7BID2_9PLEO|nr:hypothetical protein T440DRAFT_441272 [Plenodomus tracheiphilus IPT5]
MSATTLPTARQFVTQLLNSLSSIEPVGDAAPPTNPLQNVPEEVKKQLLSLQVLFPNEFVPALDLLDRRLVTRLHIRDNEYEHKNNTPHHPQPPQLNPEYNTMTKPHTPHQPTHPHRPHRTIYYVRSAQTRSTRFSTSIDTTSSYEVRLHAWTCSCPAFTFSAFPAVSAPPLPSTSPPLPHIPTSPSKVKAYPILSLSRHAETSAQGGKEAWVFGGVALDHGMPPVCKHLLACVLVERCKGLFAGFVEEKGVCVEEAAGWAAGWGD